MNLCELLAQALEHAPEGPVKDAVQAAIDVAGCGVVVANSGGGPGTPKDPDEK